MTVNAPPPSNPLPAVSVIVASFAPPPAADELIKNPSLLEFIVTFEPGNKEPLKTPVGNIAVTLPVVTVPTVVIADCKKCSPATKFVVASWSTCEEPLIVPAPPPPDASIFKVSLPDAVSYTHLTLPTILLE